MNLMNLEKKPAVAKLSAVESTMKDSLANLAIEVIGTSKRTALIPLKNDHLSTKYSELVKLGLGGSMNAKALKERIDSINAYNENILKAHKLLDYIRTMNKFLGDSVILVSRDAFYRLCHKYELSIGLLGQFTGIIPDSNIKELSIIKDKLDKYSGYALLNTNENVVRVFDIYNYSDKSDSSIREYFDYNFNIVHASDHIYNMTYIEEFKNEEWAERVSLKAHYVHRDDMFIDCPKSNLQEKVIVSSSAIDPIVFQYCPFGVLVYTMWGDEAEDKVFEEYKRLNNLV